MGTLPGCSSPGPRNFAEGFPSCQCWPESSLADLEHPRRTAKAKAGACPQGSRGPARPFWAGTGHEGDVQGWLKEQKVGQFLLPLPQGKPVSSTICWDLEGRGRPPPGTGGLAVTLLSCSSIRRCPVFTEKPETYGTTLNSSPGALLASLAAPPAFHGLGRRGWAVSSPDQGSGSQPS